MTETLKVAPTNELSKKYFSFQIKGWTNFDPMDKTLAKVADHIERGDGFLTLVEVLRVEDDVASIDDEEVRECFENLLAAKRLIQNVNELPAKVKEELRAALKSEDGVVPTRIVTLAPGPSAGEEAGSRVKRWP
jgi:hypothetical protein